MENDNLICLSPRKVMPNAFAWQAEEEKVQPKIISCLSALVAPQFWALT